MNLNIETYYTASINYLQHNIYIAAGLAGILFLLLLKRPKFFFILIFVVAINIALFYVISYTASLGANHKNNLIQKSELQMKNYLSDSKERKIK